MKNKKEQRTQRIAKIIVILVALSMVGTTVLWALQVVV